MLLSIILYIFIVFIIFFKFTLFLYFIFNSLEHYGLFIFYIFPIVLFYIISCILHYFILTQYSYSKCHQSHLFLFSAILGGFKRNIKHSAIKYLSNSYERASDHLISDHNTFLCDFIFKSNILFLDVVSWFYNHFMEINWSLFITWPVEFVSWN